MRIKQFFKHRSICILLLIGLFFALQGVLDLNGLSAKDKKSAERLPDVSIRFEFDKRLEARPYRVFLVRDKELHNIYWEWKEPNLFQFYKPGQTTYDFFNIKPGIYWVGITLNYLRTDGRVIECEFVRPSIVTGGSEDTRNRIEIKRNKTVIVDFIILLSLEKRSEQDINAESAEFPKIEKKTKAKSPEEEMMLDENYFPLGVAAFLSVKRSCSKDIVHSEIEFLIYGFDDYPFEDSQGKDNK